MPRPQTQRRNFNSRRTLFDTNILLDIVDSTRPFCEDARRALRMCNGSGNGEMGVITPMSLKDAYYLLSKRFGKNNALACVKFLAGQLVVLPLSAEECLIASESDEPDFEDGLVRAAAELNDVDFILTRDAKAFKRSKIRAITCEEYLEIVGIQDLVP